VLVIEDDPAAADLVATHLRRAGYPVTVATGGGEGLTLAGAITPALILLDLYLPDVDGWEVLRRLKSEARTGHIPVVIISVVDDHEVGLALGAVDYFVKPLDYERLVAWLVQHGYVPPASHLTGAVLAIDDDPATLAVIKETLEREGLRVRCADSGRRGLELARTNRFDLIMCDLVMPDIDGFAVVNALADDPSTRNTPVLVFTALDLTEQDKVRLAGKVSAVAAKDHQPAAHQAWIGLLATLIGQPKPPDNAVTQLVSL
jgi:CheY-like chemotaxis protein